MTVRPPSPESEAAFRRHLGKGLIIFGARRPDNLPPRSTEPVPDEIDAPIRPETEVDEQMDSAMRLPK